MPRQAKRNQDTEAPAFLGRRAGGSGSGVYRKQNGPVTHLAAEGIERPFELPANQRPRLLIIVAIAVAISAALIVAYNLAVMNDASKTQEKVLAAIDRDVALELPQMKAYAGKTNEAMFESFKSDGYTIFNNSNDEDKNVDGFDVFKVASDIDPEEAASAYAEGIENLGPVDAARYLAGSWRFLVSRANNVEMRLRYADFSAESTEAAIQAALESQGFDDAKIEDLAQDTMGNTNISGTFKKDKVTYTYTVSACDLSQVYDIEGAPENAQFVGIKVTPES